MMMRLRRFGAGILLGLALLPSFAGAQSPAETAAGADACIAAIATRMGREQRLYRAALFGRTAAADAPLGAVRFTDDGVMYMKRGDGSWQTSGEGADPLTNAEMDAEGEKDVLCETHPSSCITVPRKGLFEVRRAQTTDIAILPPLLQAQRSLLYRALTICELADLSVSRKATEPLAVQIDGGLPMTMPPITACRFEGAVNVGNLQKIVTQRCQEMAQSLIDRERELLTLIVSYDSAVRSLYQFAGPFDDFLRGWRASILTPVWQAARVLRWMPRIPCFLAPCNE